jgi:hypothetical protein
VTIIWIELAREPQYWLSFERTVETIDGIWLELASTLVAVVALPELGYQWMITKSAEEQAIGKTVSFQGFGDNELVCPSGQYPGVVTTRPTLILESTAFIALL